MKTLTIKNPTSNPVIDLSLDTININKQALVFVSTRNSAEKTAEDISKKITKSSEKLEKLSYEILNTLQTPTKQCQRLANCVKKGIAFHHAGLVAKQRDLIETNFRNGTIKIISCTPTLALGISMPAYRTIIRDLRRYGRRGYDWIPVLEYLQQAGRAGRPEYDTEGQSIAIASTEPEKQKIIETYLNGESEDIFSKLAVEPVLRTYLLSLISIRFVNDKKQIMDFFSKTFWAYQFADLNKLESIIDKMLHLLNKWEFITYNEPEDFISANEIIDEKITATTLGTRVAQLYLDPLTANHLIECLKTAERKQAIDFSFLQAISNTLEMHPLLRVRKKEEDKINDDIVKYENYFLQDEPSMFEPEYDSYLNSVKTSLFFLEWVNEKDDEYLMENYNIRPGETRAKLNIADWLLYCMEEFCKLTQLHHLVKEIVKVRIRIKYGVKEELLPLLKLKSIGRVRARKLFTNKIKTIGDVKSADTTKLIQILGKKTALEIKKQVGEEVKGTPKGKRKGQLSLEKY